MTSCSRAVTVSAPCQHSCLPRLRASLSSRRGSTPPAPQTGGSPFGSHWTQLTVSRRRTRRVCVVCGVRGRALRLCVPLASRRAGCLSQVSDPIQHISTRAAELERLSRARVYVDCLQRVASLSEEAKQLAEVRVRARAAASAALRWHSPQGGRGAGSGSWQRVPCVCRAMRGPGRVCGSAWRRCGRGARE